MFGLVRWAREQLEESEETPKQYANRVIDRHHRKIADVVNALTDNPNAQDPMHYLAKQYAISHKTIVQHGTHLPRPLRDLYKQSADAFEKSAKIHDSTDPDDHTTAAAAHAKALDALMNGVIGEHGENVHTYPENHEHHLSNAIDHHSVARSYHEKAAKALKSAKAAKEESVHARINAKPNFIEAMILEGYELTLAYDKRCAVFNEHIERKETLEEHLQRRYLVCLENVEYYTNRYAILTEAGDDAKARTMAAIARAHAASANAWKQSREAVRSKNLEHHRIAGRAHEKAVGAIGLAQLHIHDSTDYPEDSAKLAQALHGHRKSIAYHASQEPDVAEKIRQAPKKASASTQAFADDYRNSPLHKMIQKLPGRQRDPVTK